MTLREKIETEWTTFETVADVAPGEHLVPIAKLHAQFREHLQHRTLVTRALFGRILARRGYARVYRKHIAGGLVALNRGLDEN